MADYDWRADLHEVKLNGIRGTTKTQTAMGDRALDRLAAHIERLERIVDDLRAALIAVAQSEASDG